MKLIDYNKKEKIIDKKKKKKNKNILIYINNNKTKKSKLIKDIEKENNKIRSKILKTKRKSAMFSPFFNKNNNTKGLFKFGKNKKKKQRIYELYDFNNINKNDSLKKKE